MMQLMTEATEEAQSQDSIEGVDYCSQVTETHELETLKSGPPSPACKDQDVKQIGQTFAHHR